MARQKSHKSEDMLAWRRRQKPGAIMKPETFDKIVEEAQKRGMSKARAKKVAGAAYWQAVEAKFQSRKR